MTPIAAWLRETRESQHRTSDGLPWSQDDFLAALEADTGWHLHRPNYSGYETGKATPSPATLRKLVMFWAGRGIEAPDFDAPPPPVDSRDPMTRLADAIEAQGTLVAAIAALTAELREARMERATMAARVERMEALLDVLAPQAMRDAAERDAPHHSTGSGR